jgi:hypothetical protein
VRRPAGKSRRQKDTAQDIEALFFVLHVLQRPASHALAFHPKAKTCYPVRLREE